MSDDQKLAQQIAEFEQKLDACRDAIGDGFSWRWLSRSDLQPVIPGGMAVAPQQASPPDESATWAAAQVALRNGFRWRRLSYTSIARQLEARTTAPAVTAPSESLDDELIDLDAQRLVDDEVDQARATRDPAEGVVPWAMLDAGVGFGRFVHRIFETLDFKTGCARADRSPLAPHVARVAAEVGFRVRPEHVPVLVSGLEQVLRAPLGDDDGEWAFSLADIDVADRLDEVRFDLRMSASHGGWFDAWTDALLDSDPWWLSYRDRLRAGVRGSLEGFLNGSIDLVFRRRREGADRWYIVDYKTNRMTRGSRLPTWSDFSPGQLRDGMLEHDYPLQYLLYCVAWHRHLKSTLSDYSYDRHFGGVAYLFVRGMGRSSGEGVYRHRPPRAWIEALDRGIG
jgi:exodeoxyribonuclease V beta subunit